jgi:hypothetical protein
VSVAWVLQIAIGAGIPFEVQQVNLYTEYHRIRCTRTLLQLPVILIAKRQTLGLSLSHSQIEGRTLRLYIPIATSTPTCDTSTRARRPSTTTRSTPLGGHSRCSTSVLSPSGSYSSPSPAKSAPPNLSRSCPSAHPSYP